MSEKAFTPRADRPTLMREHGAARARRAAAAAGSAEWRAAASEVAELEIEIAKFEALRVAPARIARPEAKAK